MNSDFVSQAVIDLLRLNLIEELACSRKADLHQLALRVFQVCLKFCISLEVKWIPRDLNTRADAISKLIDHDDYTINDAIFQRIDHFWGPILLRFACSYNAYLSTFNTRFFQNGCEA